MRQAIFARIGFQMQEGTIWRQDGKKFMGGWVWAKSGGLINKWAISGYAM